MRAFKVVGAVRFPLEGKSGIFAPAGRLKSLSIPVHLALLSVT